MTTMPIDWSAAHDPAVREQAERRARRTARPSVLAVVGTIGRNISARVAARAGTVAPDLLEVGGLGALTYGAWTWAEAAGWAVGGLSALIFSAKLRA